jgi:hypothetical protein
MLCSFTYFLALGVDVSLLHIGLIDDVVSQQKLDLERLPNIDILPL